MGGFDSPRPAQPGVSTPITLRVGGADPKIRKPADTALHVQDEPLVP